MGTSDNSLLDSDRLRSDGAMSQTSCVRRHPHTCTHAHTSQRRRRYSATSAVIWSAHVTVKRRCTSVCRRHRAPVLVITSGQRILTKGSIARGGVSPAKINQTLIMHLSIPIIKKLHYARSISSNYKLHYKIHSVHGCSVHTTRDHGP